MIFYLGYLKNVWVHSGTVWNCTAEFDEAVEF